MYNFEACHIISKKNGGNDELDNLVAGCIKCNRRMGTENLETYKNRIYPEK
jgi:5-methylcytosine-specific restriction endonuclease McrA